jgi:NAD(P)H-dependent flavin oxidoreductase YrpB (nitropropane dioxygenase family)
MRTHAKRLLLGVCGAATVGTILSAQAPAGDLDAHISAAKAAAGLDYRATFVNLCFPGANPALP